MTDPQRVDVERFTQGDGYIAGNGEMIADAAGEWVRHSDYAALLQQLAEAERAREEATGLVRELFKRVNRLPFNLASQVAAFLAANGMAMAHTHSAGGE